MVRHDDGVMEAQRLGFGIALDEVAKPLGAAEFAAAAASRGAGEQYEPLCRGSSQSRNWRPHRQPAQYRL